MRSFLRFLRYLATTFLFLAAMLPASWLITMTFTPFWLWFDESFGIESFGHTGPAAWCFLAIYGILAGTGTALYWHDKLSGRLRTGTHQQDDS